MQRPGNVPASNEHTARRTQMEIVLSISRRRHRFLEDRRGALGSR